MGPPRRSIFYWSFAVGSSFLRRLKNRVRVVALARASAMGLRGVDSHDAARHPGQNNSQGNQQDHFTQQGQEQTGTGLAQSHKGGLAGQLSAKGPDAAKEDGA